MTNLLIISDYQPLSFILGRPVSVVILICIFSIIALSFKKNKGTKEEMRDQFQIYEEHLVNPLGRKVQSVVHKKWCEDVINYNY